MGKPVYTLTAGEFFGENNVYGPEKQIPVAFTVEETILIQLTSDMVEDRLGEPIYYAILRNFLQKGFDNSKELCFLTDV